jgi:diadenosine tetraphosphate (Ap4A) HIT family hydrolase
MKLLSLEDIVGLDAYDALRAAYRDAIIAHKRQRRLPIGEEVTLVFEDRETLRFQVQEMLWVERIAEPDKIQHELDVYNELMPDEGELSATLFIEITDAARIRPGLDRLIGIDEHVSLELGPQDASDSIRAHFDPKQLEENRISAVQYIRFALGAAQLRRFRDPAAPARVRIDHPNYRHSAALPAPVRANLARGLCGDIPSLLPREPAAEEPAERVLFATQRVRAVLPRRPRAPGHVVIEPVEPSGSLFEADRELELEILSAVKRAAADLIREHGSCRIHTDVGTQGQKIRWHIYPFAA